MGKSRCADPRQRATTINIVGSGRVGERGRARGARTIYQSHMRYRDNMSHHNSDQSNNSPPRVRSVETAPMIEQRRGRLRAKLSA